MATLLQDGQVDRATGVGYEASGPLVDLPEVNTEPPTMDEGVNITITPKPLATSVDDRDKKALAAGYTMEQIEAYKSSKAKAEPVVTNDAVVEPTADVPQLQQTVAKAQQSNLKKDDIIAGMKANGYSEENISSAMQGAKPDWKRWTNFDPNTSQEEARDIADLYRNIYEERDPLIMDGVNLFSSEQSEIKRNQVLELNKSLVTSLRERDINAFINPDSHELMMLDENGMEQELNSGVLNSMFNAKAELAGGVIGGVLSGMATANAMSAAIPPVTPPSAFVKGAIVAGGGIVGGAMGVMAGRAMDITVSAFKLKEDLEGELYRKQIIDAGISDVLDSVLIGGIGAVAYKGVVKGYDMFLGGHSREALKYIKETYLLSDDQVNEIHQTFIKAQGKELKVASKLPFKESRKANKTEQKIAAVLHTSGSRRNIENLGEAASRDATVASVIETNINNRAKELNKFISSTSDVNVGKKVRDDLNFYQKDVKEFYGMVKDSASDVIDDTDFTFSPSEVALPPFIQRLRTEFVNNPDALSSFTSHILKIEEALAKPNFSNLIELRQTINEIAFTKKLDYSERKTLMAAQARIDSLIDKTAKTYMSNGDAWVKEFALAKGEYRNMKRIEENFMYKSIVSEASTEGNIQSTLNKWGNLEDVNAGVYNQVVERLSPKTRVKVESAAVSNLVNKLTKGDPTGVQAINFPELDRLVSELNITTPEGKFLQKTIKDYSTYMGDYGMAGITGSVQGLPGNIISPATTLKGKLDATLTGTVFQFIRSNIAMTKTGRGQALVKNSIRLMQDPLHAKKAEEFIRMMPTESQPQMRSLVKELQIEYAKNPPKANPNVKTMFTSNEETSGKLGNGTYLSARDSKGRFTKQVDTTKIAGPMDINKALGRVVSEKELRTKPSIQKTLERLGYIGISDGDNVKLFGKTTETTSVVRGSKGQLLNTTNTKKIVKGGKEETLQVVTGKTGDLVKTVETNKNTKD